MRPRSWANWGLMRSPACLLAVAITSPDATTVVWARYAIAKITVTFKSTFQFSYAHWMTNEFMQEWWELPWPD